MLNPKYNFIFVNYKNEYWRAYTNPKNYYFNPGEEIYV